MELTLEPGTTIRNIHNGVDYTVVEFGPFVQLEDGGGYVQMYWSRQDVREHFVEVGKGDDLDLMEFRGCMKYRGYDGSIEYCSESVCYHGRILNADNALITYEGEDEAALERSFHEVVDLYIKDTEKRQVEEIKKRGFPWLYGSRLKEHPNSICPYPRPSDGGERNED